MNINNQTEYKKSLGPRLFILLTVCMIVVAMAVPAFALELPEGLPPFPSDTVANMPALLFVDSEGYYKLLSYNGDLTPNQVFVFTGGSFYLNGAQVSFMVRTFRPGVSGMGSAISQSSAFVIDWNNAIASDFIVVNDSGKRLFPPLPPPDLGQEVTGVLPTVLSWIQQTLNALFVEGGALQGLLLLVAVPVAITLLFLAAKFIRNCIWGA